MWLFGPITPEHKSLNWRNSYITGTNAQTQEILSKLWSLALQNKPEVGVILDSEMNFKSHNNITKRISQELELSLEDAKKLTHAFVFVT